MAVLKKASYVVKPAEATWNGILPLSEFDQSGVVTHAPSIYMFEGLPPTTTTNQESVSCRLRESLSRALVSFYPLAGRVRWIEGRRLELDCNAMGAEFIEAESTNEITDDFAGHDFFSSFSSKMFQKLLPKVDYEKQPLHELPLCLVQLTRFRCGGFSIGLMKSHVVKDGHGAFDFVMEWARLARGDQTQPLTEPYYMDRRPLIQLAEAAAAATNFNNIASHVEGFSHLPVVIDNEDKDKDKDNEADASVVKESCKETTATVLVLTKSQVDKLKNIANANHQLESPIVGSPCRPYSRFEVIAAHIWRCATKARRHKSHQPTALCFCVDFRRRLDPPLPSRYFGNAIIDVLTFSQASELTSRPLSDACGKIREEILKVNNEYICSAMLYIINQPSLAEYQDFDDEHSFMGNPNLSIVSWLNLPVRDVDFGLGKQIYAGPGRHACDGDVMIMPGYNNDGSVLVDVCLQVAHMDEFKKYMFQDIEESVCPENTM